MAALAPNLPLAGSLAASSATARTRTYEAASATGPIGTAWTERRLLQDQGQTLLPRSQMPQSTVQSLHAVLDAQPVEEAASVMREVPRLRLELRRGEQLLGRWSSAPPRCAGCR